MVPNDWHPMPKDNIHYNKTREVSFTLSLTHPMGPKHSRVTEKQVCRKFIFRYIVEDFFCKYLARVSLLKSLINICSK